jgi:hypothetical protein
MFSFILLIRLIWNHISNFLYFILYIYKIIIVYINIKLKIINIFKIYAIYIIVTDHVSKLCDCIKSFDKYFIKFSFNHPSQKYTLAEIIISILGILKSGSQLRNFKGIPYWNTIYKHYIFLSKGDIFKKFYIHLLNTYKETQFQEKYKYSFIDSTLIYNQYGSNKNTVNNDNNFNSIYKEK